MNGDLRRDQSGSDTGNDTDYARLEHQIAWLDGKSAYHQRWYRRLKVVAIVAAALVPLVSGLDGYAPWAGLLGVIVVLAEGLQHIQQHHENWLRYRSTCENLLHEKYLYLGGAAQYEGLDADSAHRQLVASVETILAREGEQWLRLRRSVAVKDAQADVSGEASDA